MDIFKTTNWNYWVKVWNNEFYFFNEKLENITWQDNIWEITGKLRGDASIYQDLLDIASDLLKKIKRTIIDIVNWYEVFLDKADYKMYIDIDWEILSIDSPEVLIKLKDSSGKIKKLKIETKWSGSNLFTLWDRVLLYWPTWTGKTYNFLDAVKHLSTEWKIDWYDIVTITEWFEDIDFLAHIVPTETGIKYSEKSIVNLLRSASIRYDEDWNLLPQKRIAILLDELNRWSKSFLNMMLKLLDAVNWETYIIDNFINDEKIVIPIQNVLFFATMNLWWKYVWTSALDEALFDRFNVVQFTWYNAEVEDIILDSFWEFKDKCKVIIDYIRNMNTSWEIRASISTRWIKMWAEKFINTTMTKDDFFMTFNLILLFRLVSVDDFWNPNEEEKALILSKFKELWFIN